MKPKMIGSMIRPGVLPGGMRKRVQRRRNPSYNAINKAAEAALAKRGLGQRPDVFEGRKGFCR